MCLGGVKFNIDEKMCFGVINEKDCVASNYDLYLDLTNFNQTILQMIAFDNKTQNYVCCLNIKKVNLLY